jgi:hypothetical protein
MVRQRFSSFIAHNVVGFLRPMFQDRSHRRWSSKGWGMARRSWIATPLAPSPAPTMCSLIPHCWKGGRILHGNSRELDFKPPELPAFLYFLIRRLPTTNPPSSLLPRGTEAPALVGNNDNDYGRPGLLCCGISLLAGSFVMVCVEP